MMTRWALAAGSSRWPRPRWGAWWPRRSAALQGVAAAWRARGWPMSNRMARWPIWPRMIARGGCDCAGRASAISPDLALLAISGTALEAMPRGPRASPCSPRCFADRGYLPNGRLVPRAQPGAMIHDPEAAVTRLLAFLETGLMPVVGGDPIPLAAQSICVHGDSPGAVEMARRYPWHGSDRSRRHHRRLPVLQPTPSAPIFRPVAERAVLVEFGTALDHAAHDAVLRLDQALAAKPCRGFSRSRPGLRQSAGRVRPADTDHATVDRPSARPC